MIIGNYNDLISDIVDNKISNIKKIIPCRIVNIKNENCIDVLPYQEGNNRQVLFNVLVLKLPIYPIPLQTGNRGVLLVFDDILDGFEQERDNFDSHNRQHTLNNAVYLPLGLTAVEPNLKTVLENIASILTLIQTALGESGAPLATPNELLGQLISGVFGD